MIILNSFTGNRCFIKVKLLFLYHNLLKKWVWILESYNICKKMYFYKLKKYILTRHATLFSIFMAKVKIIYHFSAWKRVLEDTCKENDCICVISYFCLSSRTCLSCVAGGGFLGRKKEYRGHARGEKERRPSPPFACSSRAACTLGLGIILNRKWAKPAP